MNVLAQDGKVLFIRYVNFLRRIPVEHVVPAEKHLEDDERVEEEQNDPAPDDVENHERLLDDSFENLETVVQKQREIESLKKSIEEKETIIRNLEQQASTVENQKHIDENVDLHNIWKKIKFKMFGEDQIFVGKVVRKQKKKSLYKNILGIKLENGTTADYDFSKSVEYWKYKEEEEDLDVVEAFATVLTRAEVREMPDADKVMQDKIKKFEASVHLRG